MVSRFSVRSVVALNPCARGCRPSTIGRLCSFVAFLIVPVGIVELSRAVRKLPRALV